MPENIFKYKHSITKSDRQKKNGHKSLIVWLTGLSGSGKSTLANLLEQKLHEKGIKTYILDGDNIRSGLNEDLDFTERDRNENIRRIGEVAKLFVDAGNVVITAFISPFEKDRQTVRDLVAKDEFLEILVDCPVEVCEQRDVKGLYKKARAGEIKDFTGISSPFEKPENPDLILNTEQKSKEENVDELYNFVINKLLIPSS